DSRDAIESQKERLPDVTLALQDLAAASSQPVVAAATLPRLLDPASFNQSPVLESIQRWIQRGDVEADRAARAIGDELSDLVAVALPLLQERENQHFGAAALQ